MSTYVAPITGTVNGTATAVMMNTTDLYYEFNQNLQNPQRLHAYRHVLELAPFYVHVRGSQYIYIYIYPINFAFLLQINPL